jgi:uncharacterized membrane protein YdjX (TVP38/TMEM64 family)
VAPRKNRLLALIGFPLLLAAIFVPVAIFWRDIWHLFTSGEELRAWVASRGAAAPIVFILIQAVQVVVFVIPGEVPQIAGGWLFGTWLGALFSVLGILLGSSVSFLLARLLGVPFVHALFSKEQVSKIEQLLVSPRSAIIFFLLFVIPGIPKDILCYVAGLSPMRFFFFAGLSFLGRLPGILGSAIIGNAAAGEQWLLVAIIGGAAVILFVIGFFLRDRIVKLIARLSGADTQKDPPTLP